LRSDRPETGFIEIGSGRGEADCIVYVEGELDLLACGELAAKVYVDDELKGAWRP